MAGKQESKKLESGYYDCEKTTGHYEGDSVVYHSSTAETLVKKGHIKIGKKIKMYIPKTMKK